MKIKNCIIIAIFCLLSVYNSNAQIVEATWGGSHGYEQKVAISTGSGTIEWSVQAGQLGSCSGPLEAYAMVILNGQQEDVSWFHCSGSPGGDGDGHAGNAVANPGDFFMAWAEVGFAAGPPTNSHLALARARLDFKSVPFSIQ